MLTTTTLTHIKQLLKKPQIIGIIFLLCSSLNYGENLQITKKTSHATPSLDPNATPEAPPKIGNFALPSSQQPAPLIAFGQTILNKGQLQLYAFADYIKGSNQTTSDLLPYLTYGVTDNLTVLLATPIAIDYSQNSNHSSGFEDASMQFEYAFYSKSTSRFQAQSTIVATINVPTGSSRKQPPTGVGSPSFFIGGTYSRTYTDWYGFVSPGALLTTSQDNTKFGNEYLYQFGFGRNIFSVPSKLIVTALVELDGQYSAKNQISGFTNQNSGGNTVYITPSIWLSTQQLVFQFGVGVPVIQHLNGAQQNNNYLLATNIGWTIA